MGTLDQPSTSDDASGDAAESAYEKYLLRDASAVRARLQQLIDHRATLRAVDESGQAGMVTAPLALDATGLWVDVPRDEHALRGLLASTRITFEGAIDRVTLRFSCGPAERGEHDGRPALRVPIPLKLLHLQRREFVRREPPAGGLRCEVPVRDEHQRIEWKVATIRDIGGGGLAVLVPESEFVLAPGDTLPGCRITLPDHGEIEVTLRVQHLSTPAVRGRQVLQAGCQFVDLRPDMERKLIRYIMQLDREEVMRRRERG